MYGILGFEKMCVPGATGTKNEEIQKKKLSRFHIAHTAVVSG